jgi:hypothetical protein
MGGPTVLPRPLLLHPPVVVEVDQLAELAVDLDPVHVDVAQVGQALGGTGAGGMRGERQEQEA